MCRYTVIFHVADALYSTTLQLFTSFPATFMTYFLISGSVHLFFILSCAAVLVATFSFIAIIACRPRHSSRSRVTCLSGTSLRLSLTFVGIRETLQKQRHNTFFLIKYSYVDTVNNFMFFLFSIYSFFTGFTFTNFTFTVFAVSFEECSSFITALYYIMTTRRQCCYI